MSKKTLLHIKTVLTGMGVFVILAEVAYFFITNFKMSILDLGLLSLIAGVLIVIFTDKE